MKRQRRYWTIYGYLFREFVLSFMVAFFIFFALFLVNELLVIALRMQKKDVPVSTVFTFLLYSLPYVLSYTFPLSTMVSCLMAVGRFHSDNEMLAMRASGIRYSNIFVPFSFAAVILTLISFVMNDYFLPLGMEKRYSLLNQVALSNASVIFEPYDVSDPIQGKIIITGDIQENLIKNLIIVDRDPDANRRVIVSKDVTFRQNEQLEGVMHLNMRSPFMLSVDKNRRNSYNYTTAREADYNILLKDYASTVFSSSDPSTMTSSQVREMIREEKDRLKNNRIRQKERVASDLYQLRCRYDEMFESSLYMRQYKQSDINSLAGDYENYLIQKNRKISNKSLSRLETEYHYKFVLPTGCIALILLAFPLGLFSKRSDKAVGLGLGSIFAFVYWVLIMMAKIIGYTSDFPAVLIMWFPNVIVGIAGIIIYSIRMRQ
ncbi:MAG: LptF/LptG family permease [Spirochaetia bacterium]|nr:LptF/LptG family permease [Spirochaetia bacterium]